MKKLIVKKKSIIGPIDPYAQNVSLLLHMNGANGSTTFTDSSLNNFTVTRFGDAQISTTQSKYGGAAGYFDGNGDWLSTNDISLGISDFTLEAWIYLTSYGSNNNTIFNQGNFDNTGAFLVLIGSAPSDQKLIFYANNYERFRGTTTIPLNTWTHIAVSRLSNTYYFFINGLLEGTHSNSYDHTQTPFKIGDGYGGVRYFNGYIDDLRITKGVARYTSNFIPPQQQLPDPSDPYIDNVSLLLHMDQNQFADASYNNFTITPFGNARSSTQVVKYGDSSAYFDGNGDYLEIADNDAFELQGDDFTIECWINVTSLKGYQAIANKSYNTTDQHGWLLYFETNPPDDNEINFLVGNGSWSVILRSNLTPSLSTWYHVAVSRSGNTWRLFVDGDLKDSTTNSIVMNTGNLPMYIGRYPHFPGANLNQTFEGYIDDFRITKGIARYTSNFTPPSAQLSPLNDPYFNDVSLLLQTNRPFTDSSTNNFQLTAFGDAQINTVTKKFGSGAGYFDGDGDYVVASNPSAFNFGIQDFTIECWIRPNTNPSPQFVVGALITTASPTDQQGIFLGITPSRELYWLYSNGGSWIAPTSNPITGIIISESTWSHIAWVRNGNNTYLYVNGQQIASGSMTGTLTNTNNAILVGGRTDSNQYYAGYIDDLRITKGIARYTANFTPPTAPFSNSGPSLISSNNKLQIKKSISGDPFFNDVSLLLHMNGANGSSSFVDSSNNNFSISRFGDTVISNAQSKFGGTSAYFDGNGDYITITDSSVFGFETGDFTIEAWVYPTALQSDIVAIADLRSGGGSNGVGLFIGAGDFPQKIYFYNGSNNTVVITDTIIQLNQWTHVVGQRRGTEWSVYINGVKDAQTIVGGGDVMSSRPCFVGTACDSPGNFRNFQGYIEDLRITKGVARYTSNFTPPNQQFPDTFGLELSNKKIQIKKSSPIIFPPDYLAFWKLDDLTDSSGNGNNLTNNNGVVFGEPGIVGNGARTTWGNNGSFLTTNLAINGDATLSLWFRYDSLPVSNPQGFNDRYPLVVQKYPFFGLSIDSNYPRKLILSDLATWGLISSNEIFTVGQWCHIVITIQNNKAKVYANGVLILETPSGKTNSFESGGRLLGFGGDNVDLATSFGTDTRYDSIGIWDRVLSQQEIELLYNNGNGLEP